MGAGETIESLLIAYRRRRLAGLKGPLGDFFRAGGNAHLLEGLAIREDQLAVDVGGFGGDWTAEMLCRFGCRSVVLEPVPEFQAALRKRFGLNSRVTLLDAGLGATTGTASMTIAGDGSSAYAASADPAKKFDARILGVADFWREHVPGRVACMEINVEGAEYDLLEAMLERGLCERVDAFLIQFHRNVADHESRRQAIRDRLARTHCNDLDYPFVWERWIRH